MEPSVEGSAPGSIAASWLTAGGDHGSIAAPDPAAACCRE
jgi:hypothetical protein